MAPPKSKPSELAVEAKRTYNPYVEQMMPQYPAASYFYPDSSLLQIERTPVTNKRLRVAVIEADPVDVALDWYEANLTEAQGSDAGESPSSVALNSGIPIVNMANEKRPGGDWEAGLLAPEECLCRRSTLTRALTTAISGSMSPAIYPIPQAGGIYSPSVGQFRVLVAAWIKDADSFAVVYRSGPDAYQVWGEFKPLPVISVAPVRRPKLDGSGAQYSFVQEKELMLEKMRTVLRIAAKHEHRDLCLNAFGVGPVFRNPAGEVARMWKTILFSETEFRGMFTNVVFAIDTSQTGGAGGTAAAGGPSSSSTEGISDVDVFRHEFEPSNIFPSPYS
ncbi:MAG: hypothetical protein M1817_006668 [Caeruleum heppii]|nr:MAG: hypothetical protein M1817_006668 [Caeruleum heppii]